MAESYGWASWERVIELQKYLEPPRKVKNVVILRNSVLQLNRIAENIGLEKLNFDIEKDVHIEVRNELSLFATYPIRSHFNFVDWKRRNSEDVKYHWFTDAFEDEYERTRNNCIGKCIRILNRKPSDKEKAI